MLNPFPILFLGTLGHFVLRVVVGFLFVYLAKRQFAERKTLASSLQFPWFPFGLFSVWYLVGVEFIVGFLFIFGLYTQIAALVSIVLCIKMLIFHKRFKAACIPQRIFWVLLLSASLSLFVTGAGAFAFDLPI